MIRFAHLARAVSDEHEAGNDHSGQGELKLFHQICDKYDQNCDKYDQNCDKYDQGELSKVLWNCDIFHCSQQFVAHMRVCVLIPGTWELRRLSWWTLSSLPCLQNSHLPAGGTKNDDIRRKWTIALPSRQTRHGQSCLDQSWRPAAKKWENKLSNNQLSTQVARE